MEFTFHGCRIFVSFWFTVILAVSAVLDPSGGVLCGLLAAVVHELGHLLEMARQDCLPKRIAFKMFRVDMIDSRRNERSYQKDLRIILAGPGLNFLAAVLCFPIYLLLPYQWLGLFFSANLLVGFFNIQPIVTLDGGAALYAVLSVRLGEKKASFWTNFVSFTALVPLAALGFWILLRNPYQFSLLFISVYLMGVLVLQKTDYL